MKRRYAAATVALLCLLIPAATASADPSPQTLTTEPVEEIDIREADIQAAREYLQEKGVEADSFLASVDRNDVHLSPYVKAVEHYRDRLLAPLPGEELNLPYLIPSPQLKSMSPREQAFFMEELGGERRARADMLYNVMTSLSVQMSDNAPVLTEAQDARIKRLSAGLDMHVPPVVYGETCQGSNTLGCYYFGEVIEVTPLALAQSDCSLSTTLAHETRHYQQHMSGAWERMTLDEMEEDAREYARGHAPDPYSCKAPENPPIPDLF